MTDKLATLADTLRELGLSHPAPRLKTSATGRTVRFPDFILQLPGEGGLRQGPLAVTAWSRQGGKSAINLEKLEEPIRAEFYASMQRQLAADLEAMLKGTPEKPVTIAGIPVLVNEHLPADTYVVVCGKQTLLEIEGKLAPLVGLLGDPQ